MTAAGWQELVAVALLGTARRPVPEDLPAAWGRPVTDGEPSRRLLEIAAQHRAVAAAGRPVARLPAVEALPGDGLPPPPVAARRLLDDLLARPQPAMVNVWLAACAARGLGLAAEHWTPLAALAARSTAYDRPLLGRVLGPRGRWFLGHHPQWRRLAEAAAAEPAVLPEPGGTGAVVPETVLTEPESIFACPQPWPADLVAAALRVVAGGQLRSAGRAYATRLGAELPLAAYPMIITAAEHALYERPAPLAERRLTRECFVACELAAWTRIEIRDAFDAVEPTTERLGIPPLSL